eukprot:11197877-Karenia_brevis.AAC.1
MEETGVPIQVAGKSISKELKVISPPFSRSRARQQLSQKNIQTGDEIAAVDSGALTSDLGCSADDGEICRRGAAGSEDFLKFSTVDVSAGQVVRDASKFPLAVPAAGVTEEEKKITLEERAPSPLAVPAAG